MRNRQIQNATIVITGASCGIGRATAQLLAQRGARLVLIARREDALQEVARQCRAQGGDALAIAADVTDAEAVQRVAERGAAHFGNRIDVWINNAGVGVVGKFNEVPIESHDQVIKTNLMGYMHGAYAALPYFQRQSSGVLINLLSLGSWVPSPYAVSYAASKFGLRGFSEALRAELSDSPGIHICDVFPSFINTPAFRHCGNYTGRKMRPMPPVFDPYDVARAIVGLVEDPQPSVSVGATAVPRVAYALFPGLVRSGMKRICDRYLGRAPVTRSSDGNLFHGPSDPATVRGDHTPALSAPGKAALLATGMFAGVTTGLMLTKRH